MSDLKQFQNDYPEVYAKLLEINRALAKLQRAVENLDGGSQAVSTAEYEDLPDMLELD